MQHKITILTILSLIVITLLLPINIEAKTINSSKRNNNLIQTEYIHNFAKAKNNKKKSNNKQNTTKKEDKQTEEVTEINGCTGDDSLLGDVSNEDSVAWLLQKIFNYIKILGPSLTIILSSIDYIKAIVSSDEKQMNKVNSNFVKRMIAAVLLFFIPTITSLMFGIFGITTDCGIS